VGGFFATVGLVICAPLLTAVALLFGPAESFALYTLAFATLGGIASRNQAKAALAAGLGLAIAMIGIDGSSGTARFTFGEMHLMEGIDFLVAIVGLFAIAEVLLFLEHQGAASAIGMKLGRITVPLRTLRRCVPTMTRGTVIGFVAGVLPGAGASLGSFLAYTLEKRVSDREGTFGTGDPRGLAAPEAGNNAAAGGALVPMLTLGVPGSGTTAVLLAMLMTLNITPGPLLFQQQPDVVWGLIAALFLGNAMLLVMNIPMVGLFVRLLAVPPYVLMPAVAMISFVGIYAISGSTFDLMLMVAFGVLGYLCRKLDIPTVPIILGILLGNQMENNLRRALTISNGDWSILWGSPLAIGLWTAAVIGFLAPLLIGRYLRVTRPVDELDTVD
jgi:putative tricarboxylic transport membrane protein